MNNTQPRSISWLRGDVLDSYQMKFGGKTVGQAQVSREGLYYRIRCRCDLSGETMCRVSVRCGSNEENLGILVPGADGYELNTRIPVKRIGDESLSFFVNPHHRMTKGEYIPLHPEEPFCYIARLKDAYLERRNGKMGLIIKEPGCT